MADPVAKIRPPEQFVSLRTRWPDWRPAGLFPCAGGGGHFLCLFPFSIQTDKRAVYTERNAVQITAGDGPAVNVRRIRGSAIAHPALLLRLGSELRAYEIERKIRNQHFD